MKLKKMNLLFILVPLLLIALFKLYPVLIAIVESFFTGRIGEDRICLLYTSHKPMAKILAKKLEEFDPMFIEEPVLCENMEYYPEIAAACNIPIATGERLFSKYDFKRLLKIGGVDIIQPDLSHAGGLTEVRKIASMAEAFDVALAPHCPLGPIALASCCLLYTSRCV